MPTILAAIDLSVGSDRALRRATILATESGSSIRLLHVLEERDADAASERMAREARGVRPSEPPIMMERVKGIEPSS